MRGFLKKKKIDVPPVDNSERMLLSKDGVFLFNAFGLSLIILAIILEFAPYMEFGNNPNLEEVKRVEQSVERVYPKQIVSLLTTGEEKPVMLVFYASWCSYCGRLMPRILEMMADHQLDNVKPIFVSMDSQPRLFSKYLVKTQYYKSFCAENAARNLL